MTGVPSTPADGPATGRPTTGRPAVRLPPAAAGWGPVVVAFIAVRLYQLAAAAAHGFDGTSARTWTRWDSYQYLSIALDGYTFGRSDGHNSPYPAGTPIGNAAWMPGYPLLMRLGPAVGVTPLTAGAWIAGGAALLMLRAVERLVPAGDRPGRRWAVVFLAAFFPGFVYAHAVFPVSLAVLLLATSVRWTAGGRWWLGGLAGAAAAFTYASGYFVGPAMGLWAVLTPAGRFTIAGVWRRATRMVLPALVPVAGFAAALAMARAATGHWDAIFLIQSRYAVHATDPLATLWRYVSFAGSADRSLGLAVLQVAVVAVLWAVVVGRTAVGWRRRSAADQLLAVAAVVYWVTPLSLGGSVSPWRVMAMLTPFVPPLARRLPTAVLWATVGVFAVLGWAMCGRFLTNLAI